jgi:hypothetical protein
MAVYKLFPEKDATLYSEYPIMNTGIDEILEVSTYQDSAGNYQASRTLVKYNTSELNNILNNTISGSSFAAYLKLFNAKTQGINREVTLEIYPVSGSWDNGTGKYLDNPETANGASWYYQTNSQSGDWPVAGFANYVTASFPSSIPGGGVWYTGSNLGLDIKQTASFEYRSSTDITVNVTNTVLNWVSGSFTNEGFIIKQSDITEFLTEPLNNLELKYFSVDTNTIYPPQLELRWDDFTRNTSLSEITTSDCVISLPNNTGVYQPESIKRFRLNVRPQFPTQVFTTSSLYTTNYVLPEESYWSIKDLDTDEVVVDFDTAYTKISADSNSNYFDVYMNGLEPERYYKIQIQTIIDGSVKIIDENYYFKVVNR